jgi:arginyl-tRNA synthetase
VGSSDPVAELRAAVVGAAATLRGEAGDEAPGLRLERPKRAEQGDYATNAAMLLAPALGSPPREIAVRVGEGLTESLGDRLVRFEVAGPGFLNLVMSDGWHREALRSVLDSGARFGGGGALVPERVLLEFVSANPTGPLVAASGRHAAYGDALGRILEHHGHAVSREYYFNDAGGQIQRLGESIQAQARGEPVPEDGYHGEYVSELAAAISEAASAPAVEVAGQAVAILLDQIKTTLGRYGVRFDTFFSERSLHEGQPNAIERALARLEQAGHVYRHEGAVWVRTTTFGDREDRVVVRSNGAPTYFAADLAYMLDKRERGFDRQLDPVGADHHAWAISVKAGMAAFGLDPGSLEAPLIQFVHLVEGDERAAMSKRRGEFVTLDELLDEIGVDATRFFMLQRSHDRTLELDVALARSQSQDNPVYYVQYAHARICSVLGRLDGARVAAAVAGEGTGWDAAVDLHPSERALIKKLVDLPDEITEAAERRAPHRIAAYALELAQDFTAFYRDCRVVGASPEAVESFRVAVCVASQRVLALVLGLLGVSAPASM